MDKNTAENNLRIAIDAPGPLGNALKRIIKLLFDENVEFVYCDENTGETKDEGIRSDLIIDTIASAFIFKCDDKNKEDIVDSIIEKGASKVHNYLKEKLVIDLDEEAFISKIKDSFKKQSPGGKTVELDTSLVIIQRIPIKIGFDAENNTHGKFLYYRFTYKQYKLLFDGIRTILEECIKNSKKYKKKVTLSDKSEESYKKLCHPILYVTDTNLFEDYGEKKKAVKRKDSLYLDSSIWNRCLWLKNPLFIIELYKIVCDFREWIKENLYSRMVAVEVLDYHIRMVQEQRIARISSTGHNVFSVGSWHSETKHKLIIDPKHWDGLLPIYNRRFLLIDDYGNTKLRKIGDPPPEIDHEKIIPPLQISGEKDYSKGYYIWQAINGIYKVCNEEKSRFELWTVPNIKSAEAALRKEKNGNETKFYDVILLDYYLGSDRSDPEKIELGSTFITGIPDYIADNEVQYDHFWIFPVSSWSFALLAEIESGQTDIVNSGYFLDSGADPVTMPCLFKYKLMKFMGQQVKEATVQKDINEKTLSLYIKNIFNSSPNKSKFVDSYDIFFNLHAVFRNLSKNSNNGSLFAKSIISEFYQNFPDECWSHLINFYRICAFGSGLEWPEMWEELKFIESRVASLDDPDMKNDWLTTLHTMKQYVADLQRT